MAVVIRMARLHLLWQGSPASPTAEETHRELIKIIDFFYGTQHLWIKFFLPKEFGQSAESEAMLTAKGKYGLKALVYLAALEAGSTAHGNEIAKASNISKKFLDAILSELRNAGIVKSRRGPGGGYMLARSPRAIKAGFVIRTLDGPLAPIACASRTAYKPCRDCESIANCEVRRTMSLVRDATANILDKLSIADMIKKK